MTTLLTTHKIGVSYSYAEEPVRGEPSERVRNAITLIEHHVDDMLSEASEAVAVAESNVTSTVDYLADRVLSAITWTAENRDILLHDLKAEVKDIIYELGNEAIADVASVHEAIPHEFGDYLAWKVVTI